jgi:DNA polymerase I-like protein with 3'-5' exonuclease and polymerase domains/uracil-DNA glycosylase
MIEVNGEGPAPAQIMLVGEAPGSEEERLGRPFVGPSGLELNRMLAEVGLSRSAIFTTNVCRLRPINNDISAHIARTRKCPASDMTAFRDGWATKRIHDGFARLKKEIEIVKPNLIVAFGNLALWSLSGRWGIGDWRGSELRADILLEANPKLIPTYHPAAILRQWNWRAALLADLRRAALNAGSNEYPRADWQFRVRPTFGQAVDWLQSLAASLDASSGLRISFDLETRNQHIACAGFATDSKGAFCIPFMVVDRADGYWASSEEGVLVRLIQRILTHPNARITGQNLLYDAQYTWRWWHCVPRVSQDTMISWHTAFCELPKALDFQASLVCDRYVFWKNDGKVWDPHIGEETLWRYNCEDAARTYEIAEKNLATIAKLGLEEPHAFQQAMFWPVLQAMQRGVRIDTEARSTIAMELIEEIGKREAFLNTVLGHPINVRSIKQMFALFYGDFQLRPIMSRQTGRPTINDEALSKIAKAEPILRPVVAAIQDIRTLGVFLNTFVKAPLDWDGRMRCSYNVCGTLTFRLSSSENAFGSGTNLQNLPSDKSKSVGKASQRGGGSDSFAIPNLRRLFIPDAGFTFFDMDLDRADLQVVVWESDDEELKHMLRLGADIHTENAKLLFGPNATKHQREFAKVFIHGTNYGGSPRTMAMHTGVTVAEAARMQQRWFEAHPGIRRWQLRVDTQLRSKRVIENRWGYKWHVFDRVEGLLGEALAWGPQSTVAILINKIWHRLYTEAPEIQVLLQVHDNLSGQFPTHQAAQCIEKLKTLSRILIPYNDPLVIPVTVRTSERSWGDCIG